MKNQEGASKRIAKNTLLLYVRMLILMIISLYTSRIVLKSLGVEDFGIYNVVGGVVGMFAIISGSLSASITRFLNYEMGKGQKTSLNRIFCSSVTIQVGLSLIVIFVAETIGLWFLNNKMTIPINRIIAANWVYQLSILTFVINLISVPYNAVIIAHEKMSVFAYIGIYEGLSKLFIAFAISISPIDNLISYSFLKCCVAISVRFIYGRYCSYHFEECKYKFIFDVKQLREMFTFAGWNFIGAIAGVLRDQGGNIILNLFCGPVVNAARGISSQVNNAVTGFVTNFTMAMNPQITQSYSSGNRGYMQQLMYQGSKLSYYVLLLISLPIIVNTPYLLSLWLGHYPDYSVSFVRLTLVLSMWESIAAPMSTGLLATGNIKWYQICVGGLNLLNIPVSYLLLSNGATPEIVIIVAIIISQMALFMRLIFIKKLLSFDIVTFIIQIYLKLIIVTCLSLFATIGIYQILNVNLFSFIVVSGFCILFTSFAILFIGCSSVERTIVYSVITKTIKKIKKS